eukprot:9478772-Pyramimonas_sp.AAC.1
MQCKLIPAPGRAQCGAVEPSTRDFFACSGGLGETVKNCPVFRSEFPSPHRPVNMVFHRSPASLKAL